MRSQLLLLVGLLWLSYVQVSLGDTTESPSDPRVLRVVSTLVAPYLMERKVVPTEPSDVTTQATPTTANMTSDYNATETESVTREAVTTRRPRSPSPYDGFIPEMLDIMLDYLEDYDDYTITAVEAEEKISAYDIMMEYVKDGRADVAAGPMTVTLNKERHVDFTYAFQTFQATIVIDATHKNNYDSLYKLVYQDTEERNLLKYAVRKDGAIHKFLQNSDEPIHRDMIKYFRKNPNALKANDNDGIWMVRTGNTAYIMEGSYAAWVIGQPPCELVGVPAGFFARQYAFAVAQGSMLRDKLNIAIIEVKSDGSYQAVANKWLYPSECDSGTWKVGYSLASLVLSVILALSF